MGFLKKLFGFGRSTQYYEILDKVDYTQSTLNIAGMLHGHNEAAKKRVQVHWKKGDSAGDYGIFRKSLL